MRCSSCGFPLSPSRKCCSRCGAEVTGKAEKRQDQAGLIAPPQQGQSPFPALIIPPIAQQVSKEAVEQLPFPEANFPATSSQEEQNQAARDWPPPLTPMLPAENRASSHISQPIPKAPRRTIRLGFTIAGACMFAGCLMLVFVYIMVLTLPSLPSQQALNTSTNSSSTIGHNAAMPTENPAPKPSATASTDFPGQQYIDNARMASAVNTTMAFPTQETSNFKVNQRIYVTFSVHTKTSGTICLLWYLNNQRFTDWNYPLQAISIPIYSYAIAGNPGNGYVEIYWATQPSCANKILAQRVNFTVST
jgi:hypothetical protein